MQQVVRVARPNRKRRRTSKADAALEAGEDEIGFLADFPPLIPGENDASDDGSPANSSDNASIHEVGGMLELTESDQLGRAEEEMDFTYSFFSNDTIVHKDDGSRYHLFKCASIRCQNNGPKGEHEDHAIRCFGQNIVDAAVRGDTTKNPDGLIFAAFARAGQRPVDVTHRAHTNAEARAHIVQWVTEASRPPYLVEDRGFLFKEHPGQLSFATDAWTSPNHRAFVAWTVHLPLDGNPLSFLLDIIEVPESHSGKTLARALDQILATHSFNQKACIF
ncbi:hypothetical protein B0H14DRAFT_3492909 [Mycena olivaceomarginata]|nr:hypothetical protein B0H14DRAFT_3492909 [Mycena olivaceomarginata]